MELIAQTNAAPATTNSEPANARLALVDRLRLAEYMRASYADSGLNDVDFTQRAAADLGIAVTQHQLRYMRDQLSIPNNRPTRVVKDEPQTDMLTAELLESLRAVVSDQSLLIADLQARVIRLERFEFCERPSHRSIELHLEELS